MTFLEGFYFMEERVYMLELFFIYFLCLEHSEIHMTFFMFLKENEIRNIKPFLFDYLNGYEKLTCVSLRISLRV